MKVFDVIVVGSGSGMMIVEAALNNGMNVALVEMDKLGGTCLNRGCIPTKMILYPADIINQIKHAELLGIKAKIVEIDFAGIMKRTREFVEHDRLPMEKSIKNISGLTFYPFQGEFISDYTMKVGEETIKGTHIFIVSGARPLIPSIEGIDGIDYITNPRLIKMVEPEVSNILLSAMQKRMRIDLNTEVKQVTKNGDQIEAIAYTKDGKRKKYTANSLYIAAGRRSNADLLKVEKTGINVDDRGFISVNKNYETSKKGIYAFGDAIGKEMYKHVANREANVVWHGFREGHFHPLNYDKTPFAVFTWPQVAVVGLTEEESVKRGFKILVGEYKYANTAKGVAMMEDDGYVKVIVEDETYKILGANIIGSYAPILIQEIINVMYSGEGLIYPLVDAMHIHPALSEVVQRAFFNLHQPGHSHS
jgi:dihydrolipoamide dehydrogenase